MKFKNIFWGVLLIVIGALLLITEFTDIRLGRYFIPVILITTGALLLLKGILNSPANHH